MEIISFTLNNELNFNNSDIFENATVYREDIPNSPSVYYYYIRSQKLDNYKYILFHLKKLPWRIYFLSFLFSS